MEPEAEIIRKKDVIEWLGISDYQFRSMVRSNVIFGVKPGPRSHMCFLKAYVKSKFINSIDYVDLSDLNRREPRGHYLRKAQVLDWLRVEDRTFRTWVDTNCISGSSFNQAGRSYYLKKEIKNKFIWPFVNILTLQNKADLV